MGKKEVIKSSDFGKPGSDYFLLENHRVVLKLKMAEVCCLVGLPRTTERPHGEYHQHKQYLLLTRLLNPHSSSEPIQVTAVAMWNNNK